MEEIREYVINNNCEFHETKKRITINHIIDDIENVEAYLDYDKETNEIEMSFLKDTGSYFSRTLTEVDITILKMLIKYSEQVKE